MDNRINWIDWAKAIGIFLVVAGHIYFPEEWLSSKYIIYGFHMPFFFLISGLLHKQEEGFLKRNLQRLIIPYFAFNAIIFLPFYIPNFLSGYLSKYDLIILCKNTLFGLRFPFSGACWFLMALFWAKTINQFLLKLKPLWAIILSVAIAISGYFIYHYFSSKVVFFLCQGLLATPIITIGYFIKKYDIIELIYTRKWLTALSCIITLPVFLYLVYNLTLFDFVSCNLTENPLHGIIMAISGCYLFLIFCRTLDNFSNRFIQRISAGTIVVLAIHGHIYHSSISMISPTPNLIMSLIVCSLIMVLCYFLIGFIQKNNLLSILLLGKSKSRQEPLK